MYAVVTKNRKIIVNSLSKASRWLARYPRAAVYERIARRWERINLH